MSSYLYAKGVGESLNEDSYEVRIIRTASGSDLTTEFSLAANGFALKYESVEDSALVPGIMHSRCEVTTLWPESVHSALDTLLTDLTNSTDGDFLLEISRDSSRIWVGSILVEEFTVDEDSTNKEVQIVATDAISLLKHVDYNDDGTAYSGYQTVVEILENIQDKWALHDYLDEQSLSADSRISWAEDVYSEDDYIAALGTHPVGTVLQTVERSRIHSNPWSFENSDGNTEYISCYDLLLSLCITYQWRLYSYGISWYLVPVALAGQATDGSKLRYDGTVQSVLGMVSPYQYQKNVANDVRQKDANWQISYTPPHNEVRVTRDTSDGASVISAFNFASGVEQTDASLTYEGSDTAPSDDLYLVHGRIYIVGSALGVAEESIGNIVLKNVIKWDTGGSALYYGNSLSENVVQQQGLFYSSTYLDTQPIIAQDPVFSASANTFFHVPQEFQGVYQPSIATSRYIDFEFIIPPPTSEKTGLSITPSIVVFDNNAALSSTYLAALSVNYVQLTVQKWSNNQLELIKDFDIVANATTGRGSLDLGRTYVGALAASMGQITVQTSAGVYGTSNNWVCQDNDTARPINTLAVEETLARHNKPKVVERGTIVVRGTSAALPTPFNFFYDLDELTSYAPVNWQLNATACEVDLTLRKTGRDNIGMTTEAQNTGKVLDAPGGSTGQEPVNPLPNVRGYNKAALQKFSENWSGVIGSETLEAYFTVLPDGTGRRLDNQGDSPPEGYDVSRKIYFQLLGLHGATDGGWLALPVFQPDLNDTLADAFELIDLYMSQLTTATAGAYTFLVTYSEVSSLLLDNYAGAQAAFSLRKLRAGYTGNCIKVRRSSDNTTQDIGFNSNLELDTAALLTFCGSGDGFVHTWYDQTTAGRNAVNTSTGEQPQIVDRGSVMEINNKPAVDFDGSNDTLLTSAFAPNPDGAYNFAVVTSYERVNAPGQMSGTSWSGTTTQQNFQHTMLGSAKMRFAVRYSNNQLPRPDSTGTFTANTQIISTATFGYNICEAYYNGTQELDKESQAINATPNNNSRAMALGSRSDSGTFLLDGSLQEFIVFSNSTAHDAEDLSDELNDYYSAF